MSTVVEARGSDLAYYWRLYQGIEILPGWEAQVKREVARVLRGRNRYMAVQKLTGVPWIFHACCHEVEADSNFTKQILNGERVDRVTKNVPAGKGPWKTWEASCVYALQNKRKEDRTWKPLDEVSDWTIPRLLLEWERWNGGGYRKRGKHTPYVWSGSQWSKDSGYYTADGKYDATAKSQQVGAGVLLREIEQLGEFAAPMTDVFFN